MYRNSIKVPTAHNQRVYKEYRNKLSLLIRKAEKMHYADIISKNKSNLKKVWGILKGIINRSKKSVSQERFKLNDNTLTTDKQMISEKFNDFFVGIGPSLANKIQPQNIAPEQYLGDRILQSIYLSPVTESEILKIIKDMKNAASGYDDISPQTLKMSVHHIIVPLTYVCNMSLQQGVFPSELKIANVLPLYKASDPMQFNNYRPVSLLTSLSKVFEKMMYNRLLSFLDKFKILIELQFGFRQRHSTYMALLLLIDELTKALENKDYAVGIFLDFSKAFDTVNHVILLCKLDHYGIRGSALDWFQSYLKDRKQFVTYNGVSSQMKSIKCGVPQGSILGPILFLVYINDLVNVCQELMAILFADDTNLFKTGKDPQIIQDVINTELQRVSTWLKVNKLSLNIDKTHFMIFTKKPTRPSLDIRIDGKKINEVNNTKFLGAYIDQKLNWKDHIKYTSGKISRGIGMIIKARKYLNKESLMNLYYSFIYPYLTYCNHIWGATYVTSLRKLVVLQKKVVRIICQVKPRTPTDELFRKLGIIKFCDLNKYLICRFMFKWYKRVLPSIFDSFFTYNRDVHQYITRQSDEFHVPPVKTTMGQQSIRYRGADLWNRFLKTGYSADVSEAVFVKQLKKSVRSATL